MSAASSIVGYVNTLAKAIADQRRELIERIDTVQTPTAELTEAVRAAVQPRVMEEATACVQREMRLLENVLSMKMNEAIARAVDSLLEGRMAELEDALENKINEVIEVKMALMPSPTETAEPFTTKQQHPRKTATTRRTAAAAKEPPTIPPEPTSCENTTV